MSHPKTICLDADLEKRLDAYLELNPIKFTQLVNTALDQFISEKQTVKLLPIDTETFLNVAIGAFDKHKDAMDKLK